MPVLGEFVARQPPLARFLPETLRDSLIMLQKIQQPHVPAQMLVKHTRSRLPQAGPRKRHHPANIRLVVPAHVGAAGSLDPGRVLARQRKPHQSARDIVDVGLSTRQRRHMRFVDAAAGGAKYRLQLSRLQ
jgi:hypothetical protein